MDCVWKQKKSVYNSVSHETGDLCLKPRSFSQPQIFLQQFFFHEMRLTDKLLKCTKFNNFSLFSLRDIHVYF